MAFDLEGGRQIGGIGGGHAAGHHIGADAPHPSAARDIRCLDLVGGGGAAGAHDQAASLVAYLALAKAGVGDGLLHGNIIIGCSGTHEAQQAPVDVIFELDVKGAFDLTAKALFGIVFGKDNAGPAGAQRFHDLLAVVADTGDDAQTGDDDASHDFLPVASAEPSRWTACTRYASWAAS